MAPHTTLKEGPAHLSTPRRFTRRRTPEKNPTFTRQTSSRRWFQEPLGLNPQIEVANIEAEKLGSQQANDMDSIDPITLDNEVHPTYCRTQFPGVKYEALLPSLRLASLLIDTDCLLDFWHGILNGHEMKIHDDEDTSKYEFAIFRPRTILSAKDRAMTRLSLRALSHQFKFYHAKSVHGGECCYSGMKAASSLFDGEYRGGVVSEIWYGTDEYERILALHESQNDYTCDCSDLETLRDYFKLAALLVHEVAHAAAHTRHGYQPIFECNIMSEMGYDWECFVFSGVVCHGNDSHSMVSWPSASIGNSYTYNEWEITKVGWSPNAEVYWTIPDHYLRSVFSAAFWKDEVSDKGAQALRIPRETGTLKLVDESGALSDFPCDEEYYEAMPDRCYDEGWGNVRPIENMSEGDIDGWRRLLKIDMAAFWEVDPSWGQHGYGWQ